VNLPQPFFPPPPPLENACKDRSPFSILDTRLRLKSNTIRLFNRPATGEQLDELSVYSNLSYHTPRKKTKKISLVCFFFFFFFFGGGGCCLGLLSLPRKNETRPITVTPSSGHQRSKVKLANVLAFPLPPTRSGENDRLPFLCTSFFSFP